MKKIISTFINQKAYFVNFVLGFVIVVEAIISMCMCKEFFDDVIPILIILLFDLYIGVLVRLYMLLKGKRIDKARIKKCVMPIIRFVKSYILIISTLISLILPQIIIHKMIIHVDSVKSDNNQIFYGLESCETDSYYDKYSLPENMRYLKYVLSDEDYQALQYDEKMMVIESIIQWEANRLGVPFFELKCEYLPDNIAGQFYCEPVNTITINRKCIENGYHIENICICCIHEVRHLYQFSLCELWLNLTPEQRALEVFDGENIDVFLSNFRDYKSIEDDFYAYNTQYVERDADLYAIEELDELLQTVTINYYLSEY